MRGVACLSSEQSERGRVWGRVVKGGVGCSGDAGESAGGGGACLSSEEGSLGGGGGSGLNPWVFLSMHSFFIWLLLLYLMFHPPPSRPQYSVFMRGRGRGGVGVQSGQNFPSGALGAYGAPGAFGAHGLWYL